MTSADRGIKTYNEDYKLWPLGYTLSIFYKVCLLDYTLLQVACFSIQFLINKHTTDVQRILYNFCVCNKDTSVFAQNNGIEVIR